MAEVERTRWEYACVSVRDEGDARAAPAKQVSELNERGRDGWELVTVHSRQGWVDYLFKRPVDDDDTLPDLD